MLLCLSSSAPPNALENDETSFTKNRCWNELPPANVALNRQPISIFHLWICLALLLELIGQSAVFSVVVSQVHILSVPSGRSDYVLQGESVQMSCHYILEDGERVEVVTWKKDSQVVYIATAQNRRPVALGLFKQHVDYNTKDLLNTVSLFNVTLAFAGEYSCRVATGKSESENIASMTVIVDACHDSDWKVKTDMVNCVEQISFHCVGMYPKPSPSCSIHDDKTDQYVAGETFDMMEPLANGTYEIAMQRRYSVGNFSDNIGQLSFHCYLVVLMTTWKMGVKVKLFGEVGCVVAPPEISNGSFLLRGDRTCWNTAKENSRATYMCSDDFQLVGPSVLVCRNGSWMPDPIHLMSQPIVELSSLKLRMPYCTQRNLSFSPFIHCHSLPMLACLLLTLRLFV